MHHATVFADAAILGEEVVDGGGLHLGHDLRRFVGLGGLHGLQVVHG